MPSGPGVSESGCPRGEKETGKGNTGLIYDASWITIKRYFTFLGDTPPSERPAREAILKRPEKRK